MLLLVKQCIRAHTLGGDEHCHTPTAGTPAREASSTGQAATLTCTLGTGMLYACDCASDTTRAVCAAAELEKGAPMESSGRTKIRQGGGPQAARERGRSSNRKQTRCRVIPLHCPLHGVILVFLSLILIEIEIHYGVKFESNAQGCAVHQSVATVCRLPTDFALARAGPDRPSRHC
jgi:hypothetical protein